MKPLLRLVTLKENKPINKLSDIEEENIYDIGTGFFINKDGCFVTAGHVVSCYNEKRIIGIFNKKIYDIEINYYSFVKYEENINRLLDYALGRITANIKTPYLNVKQNIEENGTSIKIWGFTNNGHFREIIKNYPFTEINGRLAIDYNIPINAKNGITYGGKMKNAFLTYYNNKVEHSPKCMSGGPITNDSNEVIGILVRGHQRYGVGIKIINDLLIQYQ